MKGWSGQRHVAVLGALAAMHMDHHPLAVDVGDVQIKRFMQPEAAGIDDGQIGFVLRGSDRWPGCCGPPRCSARWEVGVRLRRGSAQACANRALRR